VVICAETDAGPVGLLRGDVIVGTLHTTADGIHSAGFNIIATDIIEICFMGSTDGAATNVPLSQFSIVVFDIAA